MLMFAAQSELSTTTVVNSPAEIKSQVVPDVTGDDLALEHCTLFIQTLAVTPLQVLQKHRFWSHFFSIFLFLSSRLGQCI